MKKLFALVLCMSALLFYSCNQQGIDETSIATTETTILMSTSERETTIPLMTPDRLPKPDELKLRDQSIIWEDDPKYRAAYYGFSGIIGDLGECVPIHGDKKDEMELANYLIANNIKKEDFLAAVQKNYEHLVRLREDIYYEGNELPNADIIYTFDNEIINAYYRRENPVVPEPGTYKTYESYEEYKQANP